jgi:hypothetical protein
LSVIPASEFQSQQIVNQTSIEQSSSTIEISDSQATDDYSVSDSISDTNTHPYSISDPESLWEFAKTKNGIILICFGSLAVLITIALFVFCWVRYCRGLTKSRRDAEKRFGEVILDDAPDGLDEI